MKKLSVFIEFLILLMLLFIAFLLLRNKFPDREPVPEKDDLDLSGTYVIDEEIMEGIFDGGSFIIMENGTVIADINGNNNAIGKPGDETDATSGNNESGTPADDGDNKPSDEDKNPAGSENKDPVGDENKKPVTDSAIVGKWYHWDKSQPEGSLEFAIVEYKLTDDGKAYHKTYIYSPALGAFEEWSSSYDGGPFDYTYDGTVVNINAHDRKGRIDGEKLILTRDGNDIVFTRGDAEDALAEINSIHFDSSIVGTWYHINDYGVPPGEYVIYEISFDTDMVCRQGKYSYFEHSGLWGDPPYATEEDPYFYDGNTLYVEFDRSHAYIENGILYVKERYGYEYKKLIPGNADDAYTYILETLAGQEP